MTVMSRYWLFNDSQLDAAMRDFIAALPPNAMPPDVGIPAHPAEAWIRLFLESAAAAEHGLLITVKSPT